MQIPLELWFEILAAVGVGSGDVGTVDSKSLSSCAQVCSLWRDHSQNLLFGCIDLISNAVWKFHCLIECIGTGSERSRILKNYIQVLKVHIGTTTSPQIGAKLRLELQVNWLIIIRDSTRTVCTTIVTLSFPAIVDSTMRHSKTYPAYHQLYSHHNRGEKWTHD